MPPAVDSLRPGQGVDPQQSAEAFPLVWPVNGKADRSDSRDAQWRLPARVERAQLRSEPLLDLTGVDRPSRACAGVFDEAGSVDVEMFSRFEQVELMGRQVTLEGYDLAHGRAIVAICKQGKKSARVAIESVKFAGMTPVESRWLEAWKKFAKTV